MPNKRCGNLDFHDKTVLDCFFQCKKDLHIVSHNNLKDIKITKTKANEKPVTNIYDQLEKEKKHAAANQKLLNKIAQKAKEDALEAEKKKAELEKLKEKLKEKIKSTVIKYNTEAEKN